MSLQLRIYRRASGQWRTSASGMWCWLPEAAPYLSDMGDASARLSAQAISEGTAKKDSGVYRAYFRLARVGIAKI